MILSIHNSTTRDDQTLDESPGSLQNRNVFLIADHDADHRKAQQLSCDLGLPLTMISEGELSDSDSDLDKYPISAAAKSISTDTKSISAAAKNISATTKNTDSVLYLHLTSQGLQLEYEDMILRCDFENMLPRIKPGKIQTELLVKAAKIKAKKRASDNNDPSNQNTQSGDTLTNKTTASNSTASFNSDKTTDFPEDSSLPSSPAVKSQYTVIDATAGLGQDSFLLAAAGFSVEMYEQDPIIAALLQDALERGSKNAALATVISNMHLYKQDSVSVLKDRAYALGITHPSGEAQSPIADNDSFAQTNLRKPEVIYLDPMFPARTKSAAVKKKFQLLHQLEHPCENEIELFEAAQMLRPHKIVVKRMLKGPYLANKKPSYSIKGKAIRYDCYVYA